MRPRLAALLAASVFVVIGRHAAEVRAASGNATTIVELERRPIPGTDFEMRLSLVTQPPGYSAPLHHHPGQGFVYMLEGTAESAYGDEAVKRFRRAPGIIGRSPPMLPVAWRETPTQTLFVGSWCSR